MSKEYELNTLADLMDLEEDQIDRICAELPSMIKKVKGFRDLMISVGDALGAEVACEAMAPVRWIDDGKKDITINISTEVVD